MRSGPARAGFGRATLAVLLLALGGFAGEKAWAVDASTPTIVSNAGTDNTYKVGDEILIDVPFDGVVYVLEDEDAGRLELVLSIGENSRNATYVDGSGSSDMKLHFRYTVQSGDKDEDGISIAHGTDSLVGGILVDATSTDVGRGFAAVGALSSHTVDGIIPTVTTGGVSIESTPSSGDTYGLAEAIEVEVEFDEVVHVDETVSELVLVLSIGPQSRRAAFVGGSGSTTLRFSYSVQRGDEDDDGISIGAGPGSLQGASIQDFAGNPVDRAFDAVVANDQHMVDGVTPSLNAATITSTPESGTTYGHGEEITVAVAFGEEVHATDPDENLELILSIGQHSRSAKLADGSGTTTLTFAYTVRSDDEDDDGISIGPTALRGGILQDAAGNPVDRNFGGRTADGNHRVDGVRPSLKAMSIVSNPVANDTYGLNEEIEVHVDFDEEVHVDETEEELVLVLAIGQHSRSATFVEGSGTDTLVFRYVVQSGDLDVDGISIGPTRDPRGVGNSLQGAVLSDKAGNLADATFLGLAADSGHMVDGVRPSMKRTDIASSPVANDTYGLNEEIRVEVDFGEVVFVDETDGELTLVLSIGQHSRAAAYLDGGGTDTLEFGYTVQADDFDGDGISIGPNALRGGAISDTAGNLVDRTSAGVAANPDHKVDGKIESRAPVRIVSTPAANATYGLDEEIRVQVSFDEAVHVTGALKLVLSIGAHDRDATFVGGSGTSTLTFRYVVRADDKDDDGISVGADALEGGTIEDSGGTPVNRSISGLDPDSGHKVDGISPSLSGVQIVSTPRSGGIYGLNEEIRVEIKFGEVVHVTDTAQDPTLVISIGEHLRAATLAGGSGTDTLTFRYVVQSDDYDDDGISIGANALQGGGIEDAAGNPVERTFAGLPAARGHGVDGVNPTLTSVRFISTPDADQSYGLGDEIKVAVQFGEKVHVTNTDGDLSLLLAIGPHSREALFEGGSGTDTLTFTYVVQADDYDDDGISIGPGALRGGVIQDAAGNDVDRYFPGRAADAGHKVDGTSGSTTPVNIVSSPGSSGFYGLGDEIRIEVRFGEEIHVEHGLPTLILSIGEHLRTATMTGGSGTDTLTFRYVVQTDDYDDDGISTGPHPLREGVIEDAAGNPVDRSFVTLAADSRHKVDGVSPSLKEVRIVSTPAANETYGSNEAISVEVEFGEEVHVTGAQGALSLMLSIGENLRAATYVSGSGTDTLTFRYVVQSGDSDDDGISIGSSALQGDGIEDVAGNPVVPTFDGLGADSDHKVDGVGPELTAVRIASTVDATGYYGLGDEITVEVEFGEAVHITSGDEDLSLMLSIGQHLRAATFVSGSGTDTLTFRYVVQAGDSDDDGISIGPNALQGGTIADAAGNAVDRVFAGLAADDDHLVDGVSPSLTEVRIVEPPGHDQVYGLTEEIQVEAVFGEQVHVTGGEADLSIMLSIGQHLRAAMFVSGSGTDTLTFRYVVQVGDSDDDGISIGPNALQGGTIEDAAGNAVDRVFAGLAAAGDHLVDGVSPSLTEVRIVEPPGHDGIYGLNEEIRVEVDFGEEVHVTGDVSLVLSIGEHLRVADLAGGSGTDTLTFRYVVQSGDTDDDGISIGPNALQGNGIEDAAGNAVVLGFDGLSAADNHKVDSISPELTEIRLVEPPGHDGIYGLSEEIRVEAVFGEAVHVTGGEADLSIMLSIGQHLRAATFVSGSGTEALMFRYVVQAGDSDDDGISIGPNALQGGTIEDAAGNAVDRVFAGLAVAGDHLVDGVSPSLTEVRIVEPPGHDGIYGLNEEIRVEADFGEEVHVTGVVSLVLSIGEQLRVADLAGGSGTDTLTFRYVVQSGDSDDDGISIGPNALQGGGIEDAAGNAVVLGFDGLSAADNHKVDGIGPELTEVRIVEPPGHDQVYGLNEAIRVEAIFSEKVHVTDGEADLSIMLSIGQHLRAATFVSGSGTETLTFRYVVQAGDSDDDGISIGPNALQGGTIEDGAGNAVTRTFSGLPANRRHLVETIPAVVPTVEDVTFDSDAGSNDTYTTGDEIRVHVVFNVLVYVRGEPPVLKLSIGSRERDAVFQEGSGTQTLKFQYIVEPGDTDDDGISIGPNALIGSVEDGGGNAVDLALPAKGAQPAHKVSAELMLYPLSLTLLVGQAQIVNLSEQLALLGVDYDGHFEATSDDPSIATADVDTSGRMLTITSVTEGAATITAKAMDAAIYLFFGVTVETSPEETAVLEGALAAVGRGMIASAASTIGARLETTDSGPEDDWGARGLAPNPVAAQAQWSALDGMDDRGSTFGPGHWGVDDPYLERSLGYTLAQWLRGARFEMPFGSFGNPITSWSVWGAGDWHAFEGEPESGLYDGSLTSIYLGIDAKGNGWISGAAVSHAIADASYEYGGTVGGKGRLETELNVIHPYLQWAFSERGKAWAIFGFGTGEATAEREGQEVSKASSDLSMLMGLGGMRYGFGPWVGFDFAVRGDVGFAKLQTDEGPRAIQGLTVNVQRARMGVEASLPMAFAGIPVSPFIDVAGRYDGGDGATGGGVELAGGFRYRGPMVGFDVKGRALAMHSDESYSEHGVEATLSLGPDGRRGFRLLLSPKWGGTAEAMDIFTYRGHPFAGALRRESRGWGLGTRMSYGFDMRRRPGTIVPYWELDLSRGAYRQARLGVSYELASAFAGMPHRLEISGESTESDQHGSIMRFLLSGQAHF